MECFTGMKKYLEVQIITNREKLQPSGPDSANMCLVKLQQSLINKSSLSVFFLNILLKTHIFSTDFNQLMHDFFLSCRL